MNFMFDDLKLRERIYVNELKSYPSTSRNEIFTSAVLQDWSAYLKSGIMTLVSKNAMLGKRFPHSYLPSQQNFKSHYDCIQNVPEHDVSNCGMHITTDTQIKVCSYATITKKKSEYKTKIFKKLIKQKPHIF
jgi:hypothetical protein